MIGREVCTYSSAEFRICGTVSGQRGNELALHPKYSAREKDDMSYKPKRDHNP